MWGISIDQNYHWIVGQIALFICESNTVSHDLPLSQRADKTIVSAGIQIGNTVITAYIVDCYPLQSMSVITFYSVFLNLSAFISPVSASSITFSPDFSPELELTNHRSSSSSPGKQTPAGHSRSLHRA